MFLDSTEFKRLPAYETSQRSAWKDGYYETYQINVELPAVRLHAKGKHWNSGCWFAVDRYGHNVIGGGRKADTVESYTEALALKNPAQVADAVILCPGGIFNVGIAAGNFGRPGGAWQFEGVVVQSAGKSQALYELAHIERIRNLRPNTRIPL